MALLTARCKDGRDGRDGKDGINGMNGKDGMNGLNGANGKDGKDGKIRVMSLIREARLRHFQNLLIDGTCCTCPGDNL